MRVLHILKTSVGATWALRQMRELVKLGVEVHAALPEGPLLPKYREVGVQVYPLQLDFPTRNPQQLPHRISQLRQIVARINPDIIHSHFVGTTLLMRLALGRKHPIPRVFQVPGPLHLEHRLFRQLELGLSGTADYWIGSCTWTCDRYRLSGISRDRVFLSYYGSDLDPLAQSKPGKLRAELRIGDDIKLVGMVAYMYAPKRYLGQSRGLKGHEDLIDALALLKDDVVGVFIGGAWNNAIAYEQQVRAYAQRRCGDRAIFLGTRSDVAELYPDFAVAVHPSHSENVGGAVESLLLGVPTIASNVGGFPDLVIDNQTGWLVSPKNPAELAKAIAESLSDPQHSQRLAHEGQKRAQALFDIKQNAREIVDIYTQILRQPKR